MSGYLPFGFAMGALVVAAGFSTRGGSTVRVQASSRVEKAPSCNALRLELSPLPDFPEKDRLEYE